MEGQWRELNETLDERARNGKERSEQLLAYEQLRDRCMQWLTTTESTMENFRPVGLEQEIVRKQTEDLKVSLLTNSLNILILIFYFRIMQVA